MTSVQQGVVAIYQGEDNGQLVLIRCLNSKNAISRQTCGNLGFGSSGPDAFWIAQLNERCQLKINIEGKTFEGILDSGVDI